MNQDSINKVYMEAMKLKKSSLSELELADRLTTMGFPQEISEQAAKDVLIERQKDAIAKGKERVKIGLVLLVLGALIIVAGVVFLDRFIVLPVGLLLFGLIYLAVGLWEGSKPSS